MRRSRRAAATAAVVGVCAAAWAVACAPARSGRVAAGAADGEWPAALTAARAAVSVGDYRAAESTLATFARRHAQSSPAAEATYWWALVRLDPANRGADRAAVVPVLDAYRSTDPPRRYALEAAVLRTLVVQQDSLRLALAFERATAAAAATSAPGGPRPGFVPRDSLRVRDEELARLRVEAAEAQAELERVRRRLVAPGARSRRP